MRPLLRTTLAGDDRAPRVLAAFTMLIGLYVVVHAMGLDPVPSLVRRLSGEARGSVVVAAAPREHAAIRHRPGRLSPEKRDRAVKAEPEVRTARTKPARSRTTPRTTAVDRRPEAQQSPRVVAPAVAPTAGPKRPDPKSDKPKADEPQPAPAPAPEPPPDTIVEPPPQLPEPPAVPLPDPVTPVDPGTLLPPVTVPVEPPLPNLPLLP